ncbi:MAG: M61 family metallopeptidase [Rhodoferax sp.]
MATRNRSKAALHWRIGLDHAQAHLYTVTLTLARSQRQQVLSLPVWIPGSYLVREFSKHLQGLQAWQDGRALAITQRDKCSWRLDNRRTSAIELRYQVWALDPSVRTAWLDLERAFFNGTSLLLRPEGLPAHPCLLSIDAPRHAPQWTLSTALEPQQVDARGFGTYTAPDYDHLVDCPVEMGPLWSGEFSVSGVPHRLVVNGAPAGFDGQRLLADTQRICETQWRLWHPERFTGGAQRRGKTAGAFRHYQFQLWAVHEGWGGLEHRHCTALIAPRDDLPRLPSPWEAPPKPTAPRPEGQVRLLGLISHEYFHTWNVKRLRPAEFAHYDYQQENYTELLWFFEGFTSYYDDLLLRRAGLIDDATYLGLLTKTVNSVAQTPGQRVQSVAQASFDAWVKYYRPDDNSPNASVSYYTKGALVALCLDLRLRQEGRTSLDQVLHALWQRCQGGPMREQDLREVLQELAGRSYTPELQAWVHGTDDLPVSELLRAHGVAVLEEPVGLEQRLGLRLQPGAGLRIRHVLRGGAAEQAGFNPGDEWIGVARADSAQTQWRLQQLSELAACCGDATRILALVQRDRRLLTLALELPGPEYQVRLVVQDASAAQRWLQDNTPSSI